MNYNDIDVKLLRATYYPQEIIAQALSMTMKQEPTKVLNPKLIKHILSMDHTSVLEHINYTFMITGGSRSYLAQMTRHRIASYTSGSQHYQDYRNYDAVEPINLTKEQKELYNKSIKISMKFYTDLIDSGVPKYEARQVLPNGMQNNLMITMNARSLINFFKLRLCNRNTDEIKIIAHKQLKLVKEHFPELWEFIGPVCFMTGKCNQGKMTCGIKWKQLN